MAVKITEALKEREQHRKRGTVTKKPTSPAKARRMEASSA